MGSRHRAREYAVQVLFQLDVTGEQPGEALLHFWEESRAPHDVARFTEQLVHGVRQHCELLDSVLEGSADHWKVSRMAIVDRNVLRLALYEMLYGGETPVPVILDEAIELAKHYGNSDSGPFVNGILDGIRQRMADGSLHVPSLDAGEDGSRSS